MRLLARFLILVLCGLLAGLVSAARLPRQSTQGKTCGYASCPKIEPNKLNIHLIPHTHDDVGWLKTVDQYYYGGRNDIQLAGVQYIIDSVVDSLLHDPQRKFIYVETAYLWKWWKRQSEDKKEIVKSLINEGRLEIIGGGWSMNDEAVTHYHSMIDQYTWGFRRLNDTFGSCARPKIGWQIDPFGHSREQASMFAQMGFDGLLFSRLDYQDRSNRISTKNTEFIWRGSSSLGESANLFTSVLYNFYNAPAGYCFDINCRDEPIIDDIHSPDYNLDRKVQRFLSYAIDEANYYRTKNVVFTMGGDFNYMYAEMYFKNLDKLIRNINLRNGSDFNAFYSTPSCYIKAVNDDNLSWPGKTDDFFPYASDPHAFWTGYFSSRPTLKFFERMGNNFLQVVKQLTSLTGIPDSSELQEFREAMGVLQHHDAITGTEKQHVAEDYARILDQNFGKGKRIASEAMGKLLAKKEVPIPPTFHSCFLQNISYCIHTSENNKFIVTLYNPTSQPLTTFVRLPVYGYSYSVKDFSGKEIITQMIPIPETVRNIPGRIDKATTELIFEAINISPLSYQSFYVSRNENKYNYDSGTTMKVGENLGGEFYNVKVDSEGTLRIEVKQTGLEFAQSFEYYEGAEGNNKIYGNRSSGAYIFRPKQDVAKSLPRIESYKVYKGGLVQEIHQKINDWISQVIRIYNGKNYVEFNWLVGPIPIDDKIGKEIITKYTTNINNNGEFYTDSNGREMIKRKVNFRPTWNVHLVEKVAGNYYPVTTKISIRDASNSTLFSVLTDRAQGGSSLKDGAIELMVHRRLLNDDAFGVGEALNEVAFGKGLVVSGKHYILGGKVVDADELVRQEKDLAFELALKPWMFITPLRESFEEWNEVFNMRGNSLIKSLPPSVRILTLEPWKEGEVLLRLEHAYEKDETEKYSVPVDIDLKELFVGLNVLSARETTLGANQWAEDLDRLKWQSETNEVLKNDDDISKSASGAQDKIIVRLRPMQIRTFILKVNLVKIL